ncbi:NADPH-dependent ferric siderophore reductase, contains FAD-binding and SIP domains [Micromonospora viridifaciens]|uniref:NADPH-dependent ferric siderophore reductase, contains FAD-binding and SIP domains n=1 Tax=Micromonospora viridifaciens TaxID=1881 RepID=A0A1C4YEF1_MICVI|nr:siderophore-interacting protein [Micromonospora viridifaciens]SCF19088.1 NADPH-dependent ferric siderophore reductase, contains FAD-binding and SIP domains [Micromonospora viridifaciens]
MSLLDRFLLNTTVGQVEPVTPRMRRIRLTGACLRGLAWAPGQHVRVRVDLTRLRSYSVFDHADGEHLDLCVLDHPAAGPGARWAREVRVGQPVTLTRPQGRLVLRDDGPYHLFVGDETASVAFAAMLRGLPADAQAHGVIEVRGPDDRLPLPRAGGLTWIRRDGPDGIVRALRELDLPAAPGVAYVAGEARACQAVRRHLRAERGWPSSALVIKPFWMPGRRGMD